jgi:hypothetical protein
MEQRQLQQHPVGRVHRRRAQRGDLRPVRQQRTVGQPHPARATGRAGGVAEHRDVLAAGDTELGGAGLHRPGQRRWPEHRDVPDGGGQLDVVRPAHRHGRRTVSGDGRDFPRGGLAAHRHRDRPGPQRAEQRDTEGGFVPEAN